MDPGLTIELFVDGKEDGLPDAERLHKLGLGSNSVVFLLFRQGEKPKPPSEYRRREWEAGTLAIELAHASGKPTPRSLRSASV